MFNNFSVREQQQEDTLENLKRLSISKKSHVKKVLPLDIKKKVFFANDDSESTIFPLGYSIQTRGQPFQLSLLQNASVNEIWNLIKRFVLQNSLFKGRFIGLQGLDGKVLTLSEFKAYIDQIDDQQVDLLIAYVIVKERFENVFSAIDSRLNQLNSDFLVENNYTINALAKDASFNSSAMEGNTVTKEDFEASESEEEETLTDDYKEIRVLRKMHERFQTDINNGKVYTIDEDLILKEHKEMAVCLGDEAGKFRRGNVYVTGSRHKFASPDTIRSRLDQSLKMFHSKITMATTLEDRIKAAIFIHYEIVNIHPFRDYNGRMARYVMNLVLFQYCKIPPSSIMPGIKREYLAAIREIDKNSNYSLLTTIITESIIRSIEKALYYNQVLDGMGSLLKKLTLEQLSHYCTSNGICSDLFSKSQMIRDILRCSQLLGEHALVLEMEKQDLQSIFQEQNSSMSCTELKSYLWELLSSQTNMKQFLSLFNEEVLDRFLALLRMQDTSSKEGKIKAIMEELLILGMRIELGNMSEESISDFCKELKIDSLCKSKIENIYSMIGLVYPHYATNQDLFKNDIWNIKKGTTMEELYQFYNVELINYAKKHSLNVSNKSKKGRCKIILKYLENNNKKRTHEYGAANDQKKIKQ